MDRIMEVLLYNHISVQRIERLEPTLEDLFLEVAAK